MTIVTRVVFFTLVATLFAAHCLTAQQNMRIPDAWKPPTSMKLEKNAFMDRASISQPGVASSLKTAVNSPVQFIGFMWNAYNSQSTTTNQIAYEPETGTVAIIYRAAPPIGTAESAGELVIRHSTDHGHIWQGGDQIINSGLPNNQFEVMARHPSIYLLNNGGTVDVTGLWSQLRHFPSENSAVFGEMVYMGGPLAGTLSGAVLGNEPPHFSIPTEIAPGPNGKLYSFVQTIDDMAQETGEYYMVTSIDGGRTWSVDLNKPVVIEPLPDNYIIYQPRIDVSPDGSTICIAYTAIFINEDQTFSFINNRLGYVMSTDGGESWSGPQQFAFDTWNIVGVDIDQLEGFFYPSVAVTVDGNNTPHILLTAYSAETFLPIDSTVFGELTFPNGDPEFWPLSYINLPTIRRFVNPKNATGAEQPTFSFWNEPGWAKSKDGMKLYAKWIDAPRYYIIDPIDSTLVGRDTLHDIFGTVRDMNKAEDPSTQGWQYPVYRLTETPETDEKMTKIARDAADDGTVQIIFTIMAEGEFVPGIPIPDTDDLAKAELYHLSYEIVLDAESPGTPATFDLKQNYPNPFQAATTIHYALNTSSQVQIKVYNLLGKEVATLYEGFSSPGAHTVQVNGAMLTPGVYVYRMTAGNTTQSRMMTLMR